MNSSALIMMIGTWTVVIGLTGYFFWRVLTTKPKKDND